MALTLLDKVKLSLSKSLNDDKGWFRGGNFTPVKQTKDYFNPESNNGSNFWSSKPANLLAKTQQAVQTSPFFDREIVPSSKATFGQRFTENVSNFPRFNIPIPQLNTGKGIIDKPVNIITGLAKSIPETYLNMGRNLTVGSSRTGELIGGLINKDKLPAARYSWTFAPLAEAALDYKTMGAKNLFKNTNELLKSGNLKTALKAGTKEYGTVGGASGLLRSLGEQKDKIDLGKTVYDTAYGTIGGIVFGGIIGAGSTLKSKVFGGYKNIGLDEKTAQELTNKHYVRSENRPIVFRQPKAQVDFNTKINTLLKRPVDTPVYSDDLKQYINLTQKLPNTELNFGNTIKKISKDNPIEISQPIKTGTLPPHLQKIVDEQNKIKSDFTIEDVTPKEFKPGENISTGRVFETLNGETGDMARARIVGYQIDNGKVKLIDTPNGWEARISDVGGDNIVRAGYKDKQQLINDVYDILNPNTVYPKISPIKTGGEVTKAIENKPQGVLRVKVGQNIEDSLPSVEALRTQPQLLQTNQKLNTDITQSKQSFDDIISDAKKEIGKSVEPKNKTISQTVNDIYTQWVDRYNPITKVANTAKEKLKQQGAELRPEFDPTYQVRRLTGAGGIADYRFKTKLEPIIKEMDSLKIDKGDIDVYLANKRLAGFGKAGRDVYGADPIKSSKVVSALETKYGDTIKQISEKLYRYQDEGFDEIVKSGFISPETANVIKGQNPDYAPLQRVMDEMDNYLGLPTRKTMQGSQPVLKLKGSTKQIDSPLENIIANTFKQRAVIEKNNVAKSIAGLQNIADVGFSKVAQGGNDTITVWNNGKKEFWKVGEEIANVAKGLNEENMNTLLKVFTVPASILRQGATGRNPEFMIPNIIRDQLDAGITSKYGYIPFIDYLSGLKSMITNDDVYKKWASSGAKIDLGELSGRKTISKYFDEKTAKKGLFDWLGKTLDTMGKYSEVPTRVGLFKKAYQKTGNEFLSMMDSRDATVDFARMGSKMKVANSIVPFLNVGVQGFDKLIRSVKDHPGKVLLNSLVYGALPAITTSLYNLVNHAEEYAEIPQYEKDSNFVLVKGRNEDGTVDYITIPKGNVLPVISNPVQSFIEYIAGNSQQTFKQFATQFISSTLPIVGDGQSLKEVAVKTIGSNMPQLIKPITENLMNKSFYKYNTDKEETKEIVPYYLKKEEPYKQSYKFTPSMYKAIGAVTNTSPLQVQNLMEGYLAGYAKIPAQLVEIAKSISEGKEVETNQKTLLRRFIKQTYPSNGSSQKKEEPKKSGFMERITGNVSAVEEKEQLPTNIDDLSVLYKDSASTIKNYNEKKLKIKYGISSADLDELQSDVDSAIKLKKQIEKENPEAVLQIGIETYKSGGGMNVDERVSWVKQQLNGKEGKERQDLIKLLTDSKVITDSVAKKLGESGVGGISSGKTKSKGGKITIKTVSAPKVVSTKIKTYNPPTLKLSKGINKPSIASLKNRRTIRIKV